MRGDVFTDMRIVQCPACGTRFVVDRAEREMERCPKEGCAAVVSVDECAVEIFA